MLPPSLAPLALVLAVSPLAPAFQKDKPSQKEISQELQRLHDEDQQDQDAWSDEDDEEFGRRQTARRDRVMEILELGMLGPVQDWSNAAWLLQHGDSPEDYCLAHVLSVRPAIEDLPGSGFAVAATLDRFLESIERTEIFSTQSYTETPYPAQPFGAYSSMPDSLRRVFALAPVSGERKKSGKGQPGGPSAKELPKLLKLAEQETAVPASTGEAAAVPDWLERTRAIVAAGAPESDKDHAVAAEVLLRSADANDLLMSHVCAVAAAVKGHKEGLALAAETLDRFLLAVGRAQVLGTALGQDAELRQPCRLAPEVVRRGYGLGAAARKSEK